MFVWLLQITESEEGDPVHTSIHRDGDNAIRAAHAAAKENDEVIEEDSHTKDGDGLFAWHGESDCAEYDITRFDLLD